MANNRARAYTDFIGGGTDQLDVYDGAYLSNGDMAFVKNGGNLYIYNLDAGSGATESSPYVIAPDFNAGNKRWVLQGVAALITEQIFIPFSIDNLYAIDGTNAPGNASTYTSTNGKVRAKTFAGTTQSDDVRIPWLVPRDIYAPDRIKFNVACVITAATGPSAEGVVFGLSGYSAGHGDALNGTFGTEIQSIKTAMTESQYDLIWTTLSGKVTVTDLAASDLAMLKFRRIYDDASDTYAQSIGVIGVNLQYTRFMKNG